MGPPLIWNEVEKTKDGKKIKIRIQQITQDMIEPVVQHMTEFFAPREPMNSYSKLLSDPQSVLDIQKMWRDPLSEGAGIVAILLNDDGSVPEKPTIVGANVTYISKKGDPFTPGNGEAYNSILKAVEYMTKVSNIYETYGVDKYLSALGLSVHSDYHGLGLGLDIVRAREAVCKMMGLSLTGTVFTAPASQHIAAKDGFHTVKEFVFREIDLNGYKPFENLDGKVLVMAKKYS